MSAAAAFDFDTSEDIALVFQRIVQAWGAGEGGRLDRSVTLFDCSNPDVRYYSVRADASEALPFVVRATLFVAEGVSAALTEAYELYYRLFEEGPPAKPTESSLHLTTDKQWRCYLHYYFYTDEDRRDLLKATAIIYEVATGDIYYFRDPLVANDREREGASEEDVEIEVDEVLHYEPSMDAPQNRYIIRKA